MDKNPLKILEPYLSDVTVNELMWNAFNCAFAEQNGTIVQIASPFQSEAEFEQVIDALARQKNTVNSQGLFIDGMLSEGSRFHVTRPPMSPMGSTLTIRKFSQVHRGFDKLTSGGFVSEKARIFLEACVRGKVNILISGATSAGKTTLLNAMASKADLRERIITVEDVPEIQLSHPNWVRLVAVRDGHEVSVRDCLVGCLRMRPDRIIVGECRSSEALEMLQAMNTGHDGGMTTIHANSSVEALTRLESLILFHAGSDLPIKALRRQIVDALDLVVQVRRGANGQRFVEEILEVVGMEGDMITRSALFKRSTGKGPGRLLGTGHVPSFLHRLELDAPLPKGFFEPQAFERP